MIQHFHVLLIFFIRFVLCGVWLESWRLFSCCINTFYKICTVWCMTWVLKTVWIWSLTCYLIPTGFSWFVCYVMSLPLLSGKLQFFWPAAGFDSSYLDESILVLEKMVLQNIFEWYIFFPFYSEFINHNLILFARWNLLVSIIPAMKFDRLLSAAVEWE